MYFSSNRQWNMPVSILIKNPQFHHFQLMICHKLLLYNNNFMLTCLLLTLAALALTKSSNKSADSQEFTTLVPSQQALNQGNSSNKVYGVRWSLGNHFSLQEQHKNGQLYGLTFNAYNQLKGRVSLSIKAIQVPCEYRQFNTNDNFGHLYYCELNLTTGDGLFVGRVEKELKYTLVVSSPIKKELQNTTVQEQISTIIFESRFRPISHQLSPIFLGHLNSEKNFSIYQLFQNKNINLLLFTGDFTFPLSLINYESILKTLQPITSMIAMVLINLLQIELNSENLFGNLFYTPMSQMYQSYFWLIELPKNILIMAINPLIQQTQQISYSQLQLKLINQLNNLINILDQHSFFVIVVEPFYSKTVVNSTIAALFNRINVNLYLTTKETGYFRKIIKNNTAQNKKRTNQYSFDYPIIINQGQSTEIQTNFEDYDMYLNSEGFGLLSFEGIENYRPVSVTYKHFNLVTAEVEDRFTLSRPDESFQDYADRYIRIIIISVQFAFIILVVSCISCAIKKLRGSNFLLTSMGHVEMVQEAQNSQRNQLRRRANS